MAFILAFLVLSPHEPPVVWVEIHDVSPGYGEGELKAVIEILERHDIERVVIFVIPNPRGQRPLSEYPEFTGYLKELEIMGYEMGAHGYTHTGFEFYSPKEDVKVLLSLSNSEFKKAGLNPQVFLAPRFLVDEESLPLVQKNYQEVYFLNKIMIKGETYPYYFHEFTWFNLPDWMLLPIAKTSYLSSHSDVYRLGIHMGRTDGWRLLFLDEFLSFTNAKNA